ncbi:hypothetical protein C4K68_20510 [Pokkaliibacter plantistimulans]|uniref:histidine kinase n=1 Tax=Proteobacteria bacterium 228 TaxID=2083153 RepID=A0A2S5KKR9_9PROT|nr:LuxQ periplasmic sensor domain-containing protein [Pokkaliibacter plantistimulans]PPC75434.1 hypothetical protein C4K68_20510 [Pokkaliibacter plantistimulans]
MKRYSLFAFWLSALLLLSGAGTALIYGLSYQSGLKLAEAETQRTYSQHSSLSQYLFNQYIQELDKRLLEFSQETEVLQQSQQLNQQRLDQIYYDKYRSAFDLLLIRSRTGTIDLSSPLYDTDAIASQLKALPSNQWRLISHPQTHWTAMLMAKPLINTRTGEILGQVIAGVVINDSFALIKALNASLTTDAQGIALLYNQRLLITSGQMDSSTRTLLGQSDPVSHPLVQHHDTLILNLPLRINGDDLGLNLAICLSSAPLNAFRANLNEVLLAAILTILLLSALIAILASKLSVGPLHRLVSLAQSPHSADTEFNHPISEFDLLGKLLSQLIYTLQSRERDLLALNRDLEEARHRAKTLSQQLMMLQEQERKTLARELHDELGQCLTAVSSDAYLLKHRIQDDDLARQCAESIYDTSKLMYDTVYNLIRTLRPLPLDELGLIDALVNIPILDTLQQKGVQFLLDVPDPEEVEALDDKTAIALYRISQEALTNVAKHACADNVELTLSVNKDADWVSLKIYDNGIGVLPEKAHQRYGLLGMRERAESLGGTMELQSRTGAGTWLEVHVPFGRRIIPATNQPDVADSYA